MTKVRDPVPLQVAQVLFLAPALSPEPEHPPQRSMGLMTTLRLAPLQASSKVRLTVVSRSSPRASPAKPAPPILVHADRACLHRQRHRTSSQNGSSVACIREATKILESAETSRTEGRRASSTERIETWLSIGGAVLVVSSALLLVTEHVVGILNLYEAFFGALLLVGIGVKLLCEAIVSTFDVLGVGIFLDSEDRVWILCRSGAVGRG